jgi:hypothetical protein
MGVNRVGTSECLQSAHGIADRAPVTVLDIVRTHLALAPLLKTFVAHSEIDGGCPGVQEGIIVDDGKEFGLFEGYRGRVQFDMASKGRLLFLNLFKDIANRRHSGLRLGGRNW